MNRYITALQIEPHRSVQALAAILLLQVNLALAVEPIGSCSRLSPVGPSRRARATRQRNIPFDQLQHPSRNPFDAYRGKTVPPPSLANSTRLDSLIRTASFICHCKTPSIWRLKTISIS